MIRNPPFLKPRLIGADGTQPLRHDSHYAAETLRCPLRIGARAGFRRAGQRRL